MLSALTPSPARRPARGRYKRTSLNDKYDRRIGLLESAGEPQARAAQLGLARREVDHLVQGRQNKLLKLFDVNEDTLARNGYGVTHTTPQRVSYSEAKNRIIAGGSGPLRPDSPLPDELNQLLFPPVTQGWPPHTQEPAYSPYDNPHGSHPPSSWYGQEHTTWPYHQPIPAPSAPGQHVADHEAQWFQPLQVPFSTTMRLPNEGLHPVPPPSAFGFMPLLPSDSPVERPYSSPAPARAARTAEMYFQPRPAIAPPHAPSDQRSPPPYVVDHQIAGIDSANFSVPATLSEAHRSIVEHVLPPPPPTPPLAPRVWPGKITPLKSKSIIRSLEKQAADMSSSPTISHATHLMVAESGEEDQEEEKSCKVVHLDNAVSPICGEQAYASEHPRGGTSSVQGMADSRLNADFHHCSELPPDDTLEYYLNPVKGYEDADCVSESAESPDRDVVPSKETRPAHGYRAVTPFAQHLPIVTAHAIAGAEDDLCEGISSPDSSGSPPTSALDTPSDHQYSPSTTGYVRTAEWEALSADYLMNGVNSVDSVSTSDSPDTQPKSILKRPGSRASGNRVRWSKYTEVATIELNNDEDSSEDSGEDSGDEFSSEVVEACPRAASTEVSGQPKPDDPPEGIFDAGDIPPLRVAAQSPAATLEAESHPQLPSAGEPYGSQSDITSEIDENGLEGSAGFEEATQLEDIEPPGELSQRKATGGHNSSCQAPEPLDPDCLLPPGWPDAYQVSGSQDGEQTSVTLEEGFFDAGLGGTTGFKVWRDRF